MSSWIFIRAWRRAARASGVLLLVAAASLSAAVPPPAAPAAGPAPTTQPPPSDRVFEARLPAFDQASYERAVEALLSAFEKTSGRRLIPGARAKAGLKVYSDSGAGLATPPDLVRAVINALERRGFVRGNLFLLGLNLQHLRACEFVPPLSLGGADFEGVPVYALDSGQFYDPRWFYDSPLPARIDTVRSDNSEDREQVVSEAERKSYLPVPLMFEADFWINLPMCSDHPVLGVNAALMNATLWNASNTQRFFRSPATAPAAVAEMAAIPELRAGWVCTILSLQRYQFIGGPVFNSLYTISEPLLWLSDNPVMIDSLMLERINHGRLATGFRELPVDLRLIGYAAQLGLGSGDRAHIEWIRPEESRATAP